MHPDKKKRLEARVDQVVHESLTEKGVVGPIDVLLGLGWLSSSALEDWRRGKIEYLERVVQANLPKISLAMRSLRQNAQARGLGLSETVYLRRTSGPRTELRFSKSGEPAIERAYRTQYVSPELSEKKRVGMMEKLAAPPEMVVFRIRRDSKCSRCKKALWSGNFLLMEADQPLCMSCAGLGEHVYLPAGQAALSRRARKYSARYAVVVEFSRTRKRYERQGLLVEQAALRKAEEELNKDDGGDTDGQCQAEAMVGSLPSVASVAEIAGASVRILLESRQMSLLPSGIR
jgi:hypothetical protein